jgi:hypothetical protein
MSLKTRMIRSVDFTGKITKMGDKLIVIVPNEYRDAAVNLMGITMKFHAEEIFERKELGKKEK